MGTLVGNVDKQCVEVTNCFCIPHKEHADKVEADIVYAQEMFELNKKVAPHETLVGWFATGSEITSHSALIHDFYARETKDPIHLTLDTTLNAGRVNMKAYVFVPIGVPGATSGSMFTRSNGDDGLGAGDRRPRPPPQDQAQQDQVRGARAGADQDC